MKQMAILVALLTAMRSGSPAAAQDSPITVMSFNIRYGTAEDGADSWRHRRNLVFQTIRDMNPDLLGIQEALAFQVGELDSAVTGYHHVGVGRDDGAESGEFAAIMFKANRFELLDRGTFWFSDTPEVPGSLSWGNSITRICTWVRLRDTRSGRSLYLFNVHWDHESQESRERSAQLLIHQIGTRSAPDDPVILTGDFNAGEANQAYRHLLTSGLTDTFRAIHPYADSVGTFNGFSGTSTGEKIDAVLVSEGWDIVDAAIVRRNTAGRYPSDHFPVTATVRQR